MLLEEIDWEIERTIESSQYLLKFSSSSYNSNFNNKLLQRYHLNREVEVQEGISFAKLTKLTTISWNDIRRYLRDKVISVKINISGFPRNKFKPEEGIENFVPADDINEVIGLKDPSFDIYKHLHTENISGIDMVPWDLMVLFINQKLHELLNFYGNSEDL